MFGNSLPEITVRELAAKLNTFEHFVLLDVREPWELEKARITDNRFKNAPTSRLAREGLTALPEAAKTKDALIFVICHHGVRSADVTRWLASQGWQAVFSVRGGIDAYANEIDKAVGFY